MAILYEHKLSTGVSIERTLLYICSTKDRNREQPRTYLVDRKDLHNIMKQFKIDHKVLKHNSDPVTVRIILEELEELATDTGGNPIPDQENTGVDVSMKYKIKKMIILIQVLV